LIGGQFGIAGSDLGGRRRRRQWIVTAGAVAADTPMWTSRAAWACAVATWAAGTHGAEVLRRVHLAPGLPTACHPRPSPTAVTPDNAGPSAARLEAQRVIRAIIDYKRRR
jgi:hypothetical protein